MRCINRNIVECKGGMKYYHANIGIGINRNIVECKAKSVVFGPLYFLVLIETLWNVKVIALIDSIKVTEY